MTEFTKIRQGIMLILICGIITFSAFRELTDKLFKFYVLILLGSIYLGMKAD